MSVEKTNLLLGAGELFLKKSDAANGKYIHVGALKENVQLVHEVEYVEQKPGNRLTVTRRDKISEKITLKAKVCDFKLDQLLMFLGQSVSVTGLTGTTSLRIWEELTFESVTTTKTLAQTALSLTNIVIHTLNRATKYVKGTHFTVPSAAGVKPITTTFANKTHFVAYDTLKANAHRLMVGDSVTLQEVSLKSVHKQADGKFINVEIMKATINGGLTIPFGEKDYTVMDIQFGGLGDTSKSAGQSLFRVVREP